MLLRILKRLSRIFSGLLFGLLIVVLTAKADQELPLLGQNAAINLKKEDLLGRGLYEKLQEKGYVIDDPMLSRYLSDIGETLLTALDIRLRPYRFYLVKDNSVNAFATPGGYIGVNVGLIALTRNEDELAAVLAHEIAHVELMHSLQMMEKASDVSMAGMISVLAAILMSGKDAEAASAILYSGVAGTTQSMINFTRENEYEADRVGIELLKKSDYDPDAMASFMDLLQSKEQTGAASSIEYLRTHPISANRVAEIRSRLSSLDKTPFKLRRYQQFRDYLFYLYPDGIRASRQTEFALALELTRNGKYEQAEQIYKSLLKTDVDSLWFNFAQAQNKELAGQLNQAADLYQSMLLLYPGDLAIGLRLVGIWFRQQKITKALELTQALISDHKQEPRLYHWLVDIFDQLKNPLKRRLAEADYHWYSGHRERANKLYRVLMSEGNLGAADEVNVKLKLELLTSQEQ